MATNVYFSQKVRAEQHLYEDIVIESLKMYGQDVYYLPRSIVSMDNILNEDVESNFDTSYIIEMYIENQEGFDGDGDILSKFGVELRDQANFIVSKRRWEQLVGVYNNDIDGIRPNEGDLIYLPLSKSIFEIRFVEHESPFYQLSNLPVYKLQCELFEYSGESINTGNTDLDTLINTNNAIQVSIEVDGINNNNGIDFIEGEEIQQLIVAGGSEYITGRVVQFDKSANPHMMYITDWATTDGKYHSFNTANSIVGVESGASYTVLNVYDIEDPRDNPMFANDNGTQNQDFETAGDSIIDFSESNPFGDLT